jgi:hypothetical protein
MPGLADESGDYASGQRLTSNRHGMLQSHPGAIVASQDTSRKVLARAAAIVGVEALAERLQITTRVLQHYLTGYELIPDVLFLRAVDVIIEQLPEPRRRSDPGSNATAERNGED